MTTDHDSDPDATVRMPRPTPKKEDLEDIDPDSTLIREDWGSTTIAPPPSATQQEPPAPPVQSPPQQQWDRTLRRPAFAPDRD